MMFDDILTMINVQYTTWINLTSVGRSRIIGKGNKDTNNEMSSPFGRRKFNCSCVKAPKSKHAASRIYVIIYIYINYIDIYIYI